MGDKVKEKMILAFKTIGPELIVKSYLALGVLWFIAFIFEGGLFDWMNSFHIIISLLFFPFSVALYNLVASFLFGNMIFINTWAIWLIIFIVKNFILFALAPFLGIIFIAIVILTDLTNKWSIKYNEKKDLETNE